jgi:Bacterial Ig-like domain (group 3)
VSSENQVCQANGTEWTGPNNTGTASLGTNPCYGEYVTVRNNVIANSNASGYSIGGYAKASSKGGHDEGGGSSFDVVFVNNTLYNNSKEPTGANGEFQIQHQVGSAQHNYFENNLVYAGTFNTWIYSFVKSSTSYPAPPATLDWNLYYSAAGYVPGTSIFWDDVSSYTGFANYQSTTEEDESSSNANPDFESLTSTPLNFDIAAASPAVNNGGTSLSCSIGWCDPNGSSPNSIYGASDFLGNSRMTNGAINIGAYQVTGIASNKLKVTLTAGASTLHSGGSTTLTATVTASPAGGGAPSGTVNFMLGTARLSTQTLLPTAVDTTSASMPLSASQLATGANTLTAVYSGNTIGTNCCSAKYPPAAATQVPIYPSTTSAPITVTVQ